MLYEAAHSLLTHSGKWSWLKAWGVRVAQRRGIRRAIVAVARRLAVVLHRMWVDGSEFRWSKDSAAVPAADQRQGRPKDCTAPSFSSHHEAAWRRPRREARAPCGMIS